MLFFLFIPVAAWPLGATLQPNQERYYEGEQIVCAVELNQIEENSEGDEVELTWAILGKELKRETTKVADLLTNRSATFYFQSPSPLDAVVPLKVTLCLKNSREHDKKVMAQTRVQIYPKRPSYYLSRNEFENVKIGVYDPEEILKAELAELKLPHDVIPNADLAEFLPYDIVVLAPGSKEGEGNSIFHKLQSNKGQKRTVILLDQYETQGLDLKKKGFPLSAEIQIPYIFMGKPWVEARYEEGDEKEVKKIYFDSALPHFFKKDPLARVIFLELIREGLRVKDF